MIFFFFVNSLFLGLFPCVMSKSFVFLVLVLILLYLSVTPQAQFVKILPDINRYVAQKRSGTADISLKLIFPHADTCPCPNEDAHRIFVNKVVNQVLFLL